MPNVTRKNVSAAASASGGKPLFRGLELSATLVENVKVSVSITAVSDSLDSLSELGETESPRLQMAMDRISKLMTTLSNVLLKLSDTDGAIVQNLK